jgi:hypothetical protein
MKKRSFGILGWFYSNKKKVGAIQIEVMKWSELQKGVGVFLFSF